MTLELPYDNPPDYENDQKAWDRITPDGEKELKRWKKYAEREYAKGKTPDPHWRSVIFRITNFNRKQSLAPLRHVKHGFAL